MILVDFGWITSFDNLTSLVGWDLCCRCLQSGRIAVGTALMFGKLVGQPKHDEPMGTKSAKIKKLAFYVIESSDKSSQHYRAASTYLYGPSIIRPPCAHASTDRQQTDDERKPVTDADRYRRIIEVVVRIVELT